MPITFHVSKKTAKVVGNKSQFQYQHIKLPDTKSIDKDSDELFFYRAPVCDGEIVQSSRDLTKCFLLGSNAFVNALHRAYSSEHNLIIRPEDVWLSIVNQFSFYVNGNQEELRSKFVSFDGKRKLEIFDVGTIRTVDHGQFMKRFSHKISENLKDPSIREWIIPSFTTTDDNDVIVASSMLMATMKNFFDFKVTLLCGLCDVTLLGTEQDWISVRQRAQRLLTFDNDRQQMKKWCDKLFPILDQFILSIQGKPDKNWWNRICTHIGGGSGPVYINGWLSVFCVFNEKGEWQVQDSCSERGKQFETDFFILDSNNIPSGYCSVPIEYDDNGTKYETTLVAGHISVSLPNQKTIQPNLDWFLMINNPCK